MAVREVGSGKGNESLVSVGEGVVALGWFIWIYCPEGATDINLVTDFSTPPRSRSQRQTTSGCSRKDTR